MPLSYREFWHRPPTVPDRECGIPDSCGEVFRKFLEPSTVGSRHSLAGARCSTTGEANHCSAASGSRPPPRAVPLPVAAYFHHPHPQPRGSGLDTRSLALAARPPDSCSASPTSVMPTPGADRRPAPYLFPSLRRSTTYDLNPRRRVSTLARWRSLLDHRRGQPQPCPTREQTATSRRTPPVAAYFHHPHPQPRGSGLDTRSLALAARPPESFRWRSLLDHRRAFAGARCSTTGEQTAIPPRPRPTSAAAGPRAHQLV